jgi:uncharacterized repeat protein (TIGR03806 family)
MALWSSPASRLGRVWLTLFFLLTPGCSNKKTDISAAPEPWSAPQSLAEYGLFEGDGSTQQPAEGVIPYDVNTPLFSDYAAKYRFIRLPPGTCVVYQPDEVLEFPIGTTLVKTFAFLHDLNDPARGRRLIETRLLVRKPEGWIGLTYVWNDEQTDATLKIAGATRSVSWVHSDGSSRSVNYIVPNVNQCMGCHENDKVMRPIGPRARNLNRNFEYAAGRENQLAHWQKLGILRGAPPSSEAPQLPVWNDARSWSVDQRARAWLEVNCAHCHNPLGPARTSGLDLRFDQHDLAKLGVRKIPIAAGNGSGGLSFDIVPGQPDQSILLYRIRSTEPRVMMPEVARRLVDAEGVALIRAWIASMPHS